MGIDITGIDKADLLVALYDRAQAQGVGLLLARAEPMTREHAQQLIDEHIKAALNRGIYIDYLHGRVMKVDIGGDELSPVLYDRDNGPGAAAQVVGQLRERANQPTEREG